MFEDDEDDFEKYNGNIGYQFRMAKAVFKPSTGLVTNIPHRAEPTITKDEEMQLNATNRLVAEGAKQFSGHEDVMAKILGAA